MKEELKLRLAGLHILGMRNSPIRPTWYVAEKTPYALYILSNDFLEDFPSAVFLCMWKIVVRNWAKALKLEIAKHNLNQYFCKSYLNWSFEFSHIKKPCLRSAIVGNYILLFFHLFKNKSPTWFAQFNSYNCKQKCQKIYFLRVSNRIYFNLTR